MSKTKMKRELLETLRDKMKKNSRDGMMKATIMADSPEGIIEGAKKIPEAIETAEGLMKKKKKKK